MHINRFGVSAIKHAWNFPASKDEIWSPSVFGMLFLKFSHLRETREKIQSFIRFFITAKILSVSFFCIFRALAFSYHLRWTPNLIYFQCIYFSSSNRNMLSVYVWVRWSWFTQHCMQLDFRSCLFSNYFVKINLPN